MSLLRWGLAVPISTACLVALNIAQNGPAQPASLDAVMQRDCVPLVFDGPPVITSKGGVLASEAFTPTDSAPTTLEEVLTLRTKADLVRAWRLGGAPTSVPVGTYDGALLRRGVLSPCTGFITHTLFAPFRRWRGKTFLEGGRGNNRFGGARKNRFGITSSDAREIERLIREQVRELKALNDPLMRDLQGISEKDVAAAAAAAAEAAAKSAAEAAATAGEEEQLRSFEALIGPSRLDGQPALILDYAAEGEGRSDVLWGKVLGMRDEIREVLPGVLVGLGSMRMTGGVHNCAPFVLVEAEGGAEGGGASKAAEEWPMLGGSGAFHPKAGPWPKTPAREQWSPP